MTTTTIVAAVCLGLLAGVTSGLFGVGGGILFVPLLVALGLGQVEAAATSLLAVVPTAAVGAYRQSRYGNLRVRPAIKIGVASIVGVEIGVRIATTLPEHLLRKLFGVGTPRSLQGHCGLLCALYLAIRTCWSRYCGHWIARAKRWLFRQNQDLGMTPTWRCQQKPTKSTGCYPSPDG